MESEVGLHILASVFLCGAETLREDASNMYGAEARQLVLALSLIA